MDYRFDFNVFLIGLIIMFIGVLFVKWHQKIADNLASGVVSYNKFKLVGLGICGLGLVVSLNLHYFILYNILLMIFPQIK
jgi:hypothetical protein